MLVALAMLAAFSALASDLPRWLAWSLAVAALAHGTRLALQQRRMARRSLVIAGRGDEVSIDGARVEHFTVHWRGPLAFARWHDDRGRTHRLAWWPDTLRREARRELRLAAAMPATARPAHSMAP